jgi:hypothetical protein
MRTASKLRALRWRGLILISVHAALGISLLQAADLTFTTGPTMPPTTATAVTRSLTPAGNSLRFTGYYHSVMVRGSGNRVIVDSVVRTCDLRHQQHRTLAV